MVATFKDFFEKSNGDVFLLESGAKCSQNPEPRRAIGFGREGEFITKSPENILLEKLGLRRAIGFGRENETIKNGPTGRETAVGFGRASEPAAKPASPKTTIGFKVKAKQHTR